MSRSSTKSITRSSERKSSGSGSGSGSGSKVPILNYNDILSKERKYTKLVKKYGSENVFLNHMKRLKIVVNMGLRLSDSSTRNDALVESDVICRKMSKIIARAEKRRDSYKTLKSEKKAAKRVKKLAKRSSKK